MEINKISETKLSQAEYEYFEKNLPVSSVGQHKQKIQESHKQIDGLDLSNLLNEETEKSRNTLFTVTLLTLVFILLKVDKGKIGFFSFENAQGSESVISTFLIFVTALCSYYFHKNVQIERVSKEIKFRMLKSEITNLKKLLLFYERKIGFDSDDSGNKGIDISGSTEIEFFKNVRQDVKEESLAIVALADEINEHRDFLKLWPGIIVSICWVLIAAAIFIRLFPIVKQVLG